MKATYLKKFEHYTQEELLAIIKKPALHNSYEVTAAHELLRKKTATFEEYKALTNGNTIFENSEKETPNIFLTILKWIGIVLFFPMSLVVVGYYRSKKAKKAYYAHNGPQHER